VCTSGNCGSGSSTCFVAGTLVATVDGPKAIERVRAGDWVLSKSEATGDLVAEPVTASFVTPDSETVEVRIEGEIEPIVATPGHPFFTQDRGWVRARELHAGEPLVDPLGASLVVESVSARFDHQSVYNFEVAETHTYFVGRSLVWVHNPKAALDPAATTDSLLQAPNLTPEQKKFIEDNNLQVVRVAGKDGEIMYLQRMEPANDNGTPGEHEYWYRAMSKEEYEKLKAGEDGKIPHNDDPNAYGGITQSQDYVKNPKKPYFNNNSGYVVVQFDAPGAADALKKAKMKEKIEEGALSYGLGDQGSKPPAPKKTPKLKKGQDPPPPPPTALDIFNSHLQGWQVVDLKIPTPEGWTPPTTCN
jgi:hypothetical protein